MNNIFWSIVRTMRLLFTLKGRASRREYIIFYLFLFLIYSLIPILIHIILLPYDIDSYDYNDNDVIIVIMFGVFHLFFSGIMLFSLISSKFHNLNKSYKRWFIILIIPFGFLIVLFVLFTLIVRRLHDLNLSGWWLLLISPLLMLLYILTGISSMYFLSSSYDEIEILLDVLNALSVIILAIIKGNTDTNKYGEEPKC